MPDDATATPTTRRPSPRYVRHDGSPCLRCWTAAHAQTAQHAAQHAARLAFRRDAAKHAVDGALIAVAVLALGAAAMVVVAGAWMELGEFVLAGGGGGGVGN